MATRRHADAEHRCVRLTSDDNAQVSALAHLDTRDESGCHRFPNELARSWPHAAVIVGALAASCQAATTAANRAETATAVIEATAAILAIAGAIARADTAGPAILDAQTAVIARTRLSTMVDHLGDGSWHMPGHENLPDAREHDLALSDRIEHDLQLLS